MPGDACPTADCGFQAARTASAQPPVHHPSYRCDAASLHGSQHARCPDLAIPISRPSPVGCALQAHAYVRSQTTMSHGPCPSGSARAPRRRGEPQPHGLHSRGCHGRRVTKATLSVPSQTPSLASTCTALGTLSSFTFCSDPLTLLLTRRPDRRGIARCSVVNRRADDPQPPHS